MVHKRVLLSGAGGFVGSHCLEYFLEKTDWEIICIDSFRHKGTVRRVVETVANNPRIKTYVHDLTVPIDLQLENLLFERWLDNGVVREKPIHYIINMASESAVERSVTDPISCMNNNWHLGVNMLEFARRSKGLELFTQISCYDENTRLLTPDGFKFYHELNKDDEILTLNPETRILENKKIKRVIIQNYCGEMYHFNFGRIDIKVTPNHRMYFQTLDDKIEIKSAEEISKKTYMYRLANGIWQGKKEEKTHVDGIGFIDTKILFYLCGLFIGDGFTDKQIKKVNNISGLKRKDFLQTCRDNKGRFIKTGKIGKEEFVECICHRIWFDIPENDTARKKLTKALSDLGIKYSEHNNKSGEHVYFSSEVWHNFFKQFGVHAKNKHIPKWMLEYDHEYLLELFNGLIDSDGASGTTMWYSTVSKKLVRDCCELGIKLGFFPHYKKKYYSNLLKKENRMIEGQGLGYSIYFCTTHPNFGKKHLEITKYDGKIWCCEVEDNKNLIIERNGKIAICGNTDEVYGEAPKDSAHKEWSPIVPSNPYAASKAAQEAVATSYFRSFNLPIVITNCYDMKTKVFTPQGSKSYDDIEVGDMVWTLDENENLIQEPVLKKIKMPYQGQMIQITSNKVDQCVTPNHRMMIRRCVGNPRRWGKIEEVHAENLVNLQGRIRIPTCGIWEKEHKEFIETSELIDQSNFHFNAHKLPSKLRSEWVADILGWYVSEGFTGSSTVCWGACSEKQQKEIQKLLNEINIHNYLGTGKISVICSNKGLETLVKQCGYLAKNKQIPHWAMNQSRKFLERLFIAAIKGDGSYLQIKSGYITAVYYTKSIKLAEQMSEIGLKLGMSSRICSRETWNPAKTKKSSSYIVRFRKPQADIEKRNISVIPYKDDVWCISVPSGRVFIERNGMISLSGQTMNLIGERQDVEKFLPKIVKMVAMDQEMPIYGDSISNIGTRIYLHCKCLADALIFISKRKPTCYLDAIKQGQANIRPDRYNICGDQEINNLELAQMVAKIMGKPLKYRLIPSESARPGYDRRYALDGSKLRNLGWTAPMNLEESLEKIVSWTLANPHWLV